MQRAIQTKLRSRSGASLLLGLLFLFFCTTVGAVVLTAASANAARDTRIREAQQNYLAVASAARTLRDDLAKITLTGTYHFESYDSSITYSKVGVSLGDGSLKALLQPDFEAIYLAKVQGLTPGIALYTHELSLSLGDGGLPVKATLTLDAADYRIQIALSDQNGENAMLLTLTPSPPVETHFNHYFYVLTFGSEEDGDLYYVDVFGYDAQTTVTWSPAVMTKGGTPP